MFFLFVCSSTAAASWDDYPKEWHCYYHGSGYCTTAHDDDDADWEGVLWLFFSAGQCRQPVVVVCDVVVFLFPPQHDHLLDMFGNMTQINLIRFKTAQHT